MANLMYSPKDILQQEFKTKMRGYDPIEVDEFLDGVIKDYETYNKELLALQEENDRLKAQVETLNKKQTVGSRVQQEAPKNQTVTNFDILKRLSNLEKEVFGKKLDQEVAQEVKEVPEVQETVEEIEVVEEVSAAPVDTENYTQADEADDLEKTRQF